MFRQCYQCVYVDLAYMDHCVKTFKLLKYFIRLCSDSINLQDTYPCQMYFPSITGMSNIIPRPTDVIQPLKGLKRVAVSHTATPLQINRTESGFRNMFQNT